MRIKRSRPWDLPDHAVTDPELFWNRRRLMQAAGATAVAAGQDSPWYPWPHVEALTIGEATNELALIGTGAYGHRNDTQSLAEGQLVRWHVCGRDDLGKSAPLPSWPRTVAAIHACF